MNRLIILGNGFDLAHGLPTLYSNFILDYLKTASKKAYTKGSYNDDSLQLSYIRRESRDPQPDIDSYQKISQLLNLIDGGMGSFIKADYKNDFLKSLLYRMKDSNWVDIEQFYYDKLKSLLRSLELNPNYALAELEKLNSNFSGIQSLLIKYLNEKVNEAYDFDILHSFEKIFNDAYFDESLILNFNYTKTVDSYLKNLDETSQIQIHGSIDNLDYNPIIFGYGDEYDKNYELIENIGNNDFLKFIKSFMYLRTYNYQNLLKFIEYGDFELLIIGHSCGLSDRVMLSTIFESPTCKRIKILHYKNEKNFLNNIYDISRHFKDKAQMRSKIVPFKDENKCPQGKLLIKGKK